MTLDEASRRLGLSERWTRALVKRHGIPVRKVPCCNGGRYVFTRDDIEKIWRIHERNQAELQRRSPEFFAKVGKLRLGPQVAVRSPSRVAR